MIAALLTPAATVEVSEQPIDLVKIRDFRLVPGGNFVGAEDRLVWHPKALIGVGWNSNVYAQPTEPKQDVYGSAAVGSDLIWQASPSDELAVTGEVDLIRYLEAEQARFTGWNVDARATHTAAAWIAEATAEGRRIDEPTLLTGEPVARIEALALARSSWRARRWNAGLVGWGSLTDWLEPAGTFDDVERDNHSLAVRPEAAFEVGEISRISAWTTVEHRTYPHDGRYQDSTVITPTIRLRQATGHRSTLTLEAGASVRRYADNFAGDPAYDDRDLVHPVGGIGWIWGWEERSFVRATVDQTVYDGIASNAVILRTVRAFTQLRLRWEANAQFGIAYKHYRDAGQAAGAQEHRRESMEYTASIERIIAPGIIVRLLGTWTERHSNQSDEFDRFFSACEVAGAW